MRGDADRTVKTVWTNKHARICLEKKRRKKSISQEYKYANTPCDPTEDVPVRDAVGGVPSVSARVITISPALAGTDTITAVAAAVVDVAAVVLASMVPAEDAMAGVVISAAAETCCSDLSWKRVERVHVLSTPRVQGHKKDTNTIFPTSMV